MKWYVQEQNGQLSRIGRIHLDSYMWPLDMPTASLAAAICACIAMLLFN